MERNTEIKVRLSEIEKGYVKLSMAHLGYKTMNEYVRDVLLAYAQEVIAQEVDTVRDKAIAS